MSSDWKVLLVSELADQGRKSTSSGPFGSNLVSRDYTESGVPVIRGVNMSSGRWVGGNFAWVSEEKADELSANLAFPGEIVFTQRGTLGQVCLVPDGQYDKYVLSQSQMKLRVNPSICDSLFMLYQFKSPEQQAYIDMNAIRVGVPHTNLGILRDTPCCVPPLSTQKAIAHILGALDDKIELNRKTNETLEAIAKALFKSWFVDFDPVRAKAEGRHTGLPAEISDLFPDSFEDSELGEIPSGWEIGRLEEILEIDPPRQLRKGSIAPYLEMKGVPTSGHSVLDVIGREFSSGSKFRNGDTLLARITPCLENGKTAFVDFLKDGEIGWGSTEFIVMCGRRKEINPFAYYLARSEAFRNNAIQNMVGSSGRQRVPSDAVSGFTMPLPPEEILVKFGLLATDLMRGISANADQSSIFSKIRDSLLPKLISGEIRIPDAEKMLEEVGV
jgi:type I restriction enzyme S subunit